MIFQTELEQNSDIAAYALLFFVKTEDRSYDEKKINLHLKLMINFQNQSLSLTAVYDIIAKY